MPSTISQESDVPKEKTSQKSKSNVSSKALIQLKNTFRNRICDESGLTLCAAQQHEQQREQQELHGGE